MKQGYTLIEIVVVVAATGLIMTAVVGVILGTFRAQNRTKSDNKITETGSWIINELRKNVFNSDGNSVECGEDKKSVVIKSLNDGNLTTLSCSQLDNKIASVSAVGVGNTYALNTNEVNIINCDNFADCEVTNGTVTGVTFNFMLSSDTKGIGSSKTFTTKVTLRN
jgi:prepilin-type N-terminal cleavage/methylation domain-containing protein